MSAKKMIPKTIHYCWFGDGQMSDLHKKCIESWYKFCPDYEIVEHNSQNTELDMSVEYVRQMHDQKKWAFLSDYARLDIIKKHGGVYFDVDVELVKPISALCEDCSAFFCFQKQADCRQYDEYIGTGLGFGCEKSHPILDMLMETYTQKFIFPSRRFTSPHREAQVFEKLGIKRDNTFQRIEKYGLVVYPSSWMCPRSWNSPKVEIADCTVGIHHYTNTWLKQ